ncbi:MAG TPA: transporter substrate-binding domain-containing protein, partial [Burkholderiales bacterium]
MPPRTIIGALATALLLVSPGSLAETAKPAAAPAAKPRQLSTENKPWKGDYDQMVEKRRIRVLVPYSRTLYFNDKGRERGLTAEFVRDFERWLNQKHKTHKRPVTVFIIPTTRDKLLSGVVEGLGDIAAGNLTVTDERLALVDFVSPEDQKPVSEIVVTGPKSPPIASVDDLSGKTVHVRKASSYYESLLALNQRFKKAGKAEAKLTIVPDALEDEDMMEMLNAGLLELMVVDDWKARIWAQILPKVKPLPEVKVREGGKTGWGIRKNSPQLKAVLIEFDQQFIKKQNLHEARINAYM